MAAGPSTFAPEPEAVWVGHEGDPGWKSKRQEAHAWAGQDGWGYARIELARGRPSKITLRESTPPAPSRLRYEAVRWVLELDLPDPRFVDCLNAQVAHLMMGLLDRRTPPGEPTNYPLAWQCDGAAVIQGLARAGWLDVARQLVTYFAENDFFGGFGAEDAAQARRCECWKTWPRVHDPGAGRWRGPTCAAKRNSS